MGTTPEWKTSCQDSNNASSCGLKILPRPALP